MSKRILSEIAAHGIPAAHSLVAENAVTSPRPPRRAPWPTPPGARAAPAAPERDASAPSSEPPSSDDERPLKQLLR